MSTTKKRTARIERGRGRQARRPGRRRRNAPEGDSTARPALASWRVPTDRQVERSGRPDPAAGLARDPAVPPAARPAVNRRVLAAALRRGAHPLRRRPAKIRRNSARRRSSCRSSRHPRTVDWDSAQPTDRHAGATAARRAAPRRLPAAAAGAMDVKTFTRWAKAFDRWLARTQRLDVPVRARAADDRRSVRSAAASQLSSLRLSGSSADGGSAAASERRDSDCRLRRYSASARHGLADVERFSASADGLDGGLDRQSARIEPEADARSPTNHQRRRPIAAGRFHDADADGVVQVGRADSDSSTGVAAAPIASAAGAAGGVRARERLRRRASRGRRR